VDLRTEKTFVIGRTRVMGIFDLYKPFQHECGAGSHHQFGPSWLRPTTITGPRILRIGARLEW